MSLICVNISLYLHPATKFDFFLYFLWKLIVVQTSLETEMTKSTRPMQPVLTSLPIDRNLQQRKTKTGRNYHDDFGLKF